MKPSRLFFMMAVTIQLLVPMILGIVLFLGFIFIGDAAIHSNSSDSIHTAAHLPFVSKFIVAIGMALAIVGIALAGQVIPCFVTALLLAGLATRLVPLSRPLYVVISTLIGGSAAALWFTFVPGGIYGPWGMLTIFATVGYFVSSIAVCLVEKV